ncbi:MAG: hypothetical protein PGN27_21735 [Mycolicibacterium neoaurum]|uniref:hypothetical protein n=1 Tax=Mycolicibacterium neoaurum TaxID=1795 RepID=UPI002FFB229B
MSIINMPSSVNVSGMPLTLAAVAGMSAAHRAGWAPAAAAAPQHKRRTAREIVTSVKRGTT